MHAGPEEGPCLVRPDRSVVDYTQLFSATSLMPSHVIADQLNVDADGGVAGHEFVRGGPDRQLWNTIWDLKPGIDLKRFPSSGPYKIYRCSTAAPWCWSPTTGGGAPNRHQADHGVAQGRRHPGPDQIRNVDVVDVAARARWTR